MIFDLVAKELVNRVDGFGVQADNSHPSATVYGLKCVTDIRLEAFHNGHARRLFTMSKHRLAEIPLFEQLCYLLEMSSDQFLAGAIVGLVGGNLDRPAVASQTKVGESPFRG